MSARDWALPMIDLEKKMRMEQQRCCERQCQYHKRHVRSRRHHDGFFGRSRQALSGRAPDEPGDGQHTPDQHVTRKESLDEKKGGAHSQRKTPRLRLVSCCPSEDVFARIILWTTTITRSFDAGFTSTPYLHLLLLESPQSAATHRSACCCCCCRRRWRSPLGSPPNQVRHRLHPLPDAAPQPPPAVPPCPRAVAAATA